ncbi:CAP domain-containing protein [Saccharothrix sp.]|uniref:CAP domain-containing protein n=1 Tax=Saccharothrix sp. TaxID=1873460 RepID=UPI002810FE3E|nr:CAP domain-containing protein [Saccharothrix sp.]
MFRSKRALPVVVALAGLALAGCDDPEEIGMVTATATTTVRTTSQTGTPATSPSPSSSSTTPTTTTTTTETTTTTTPPEPPATTTEVPPQQPTPPASPTKTEVEPAEAKVFNLTNAERAANGCPALGVDERLDKAARSHSADMAAQNYFSHTSKDGRTFADRIKATGYPAPGAENIAAGQRTPEAVVKGWMESPGHRANILNCKLKTLGVGMARGGSYGTYWTQNFGW